MDEFLVNFPVYVVVDLVVVDGMQQHGMPVIAELDGEPAFLLFTDDDLANRFVSESKRDGKCRAVQLNTTRELSVLLAFAQKLRGVQHVAVDLGHDDRRTRIYRIEDVAERLPERWGPTNPPAGE